MIVYPIYALRHGVIPAPAKLCMISVLGLILVMLPMRPGLAEPGEVGRLFYTPAQRIQLEDARARRVTRLGDPSKSAVPVATPAPRRFDGIVIRSDGEATRWVNGQPEVGPSSVSGLKPGQIRANGKVYEPYQIIRPLPPEPQTKETAP